MMLDTKLDEHFDVWYSEITDRQKYQVNEFLKKYPLYEIKDDISSIAEANSIEVVVPDCVLTEVKLANNEKKVVTCSFQKLVDLRMSLILVKTFKKNLRKLFENAHKNNAIRFYCMLPIYTNFETNEFGIHGAFLM